MYPSWRYHKTEEAKIIHTKAEEHPEWKDSPAHFAEEQPQPSNEAVEVMPEPEESAAKITEVGPLEKIIDHRKPKKKKV